MYKTRVLTGILLVLAVLFAQVGTVFAAPATQSTTATFTGTVTSITTQTDASGAVTAVVVTLVDSSGQSQTLNLTPAYAQTLGLVTVDPVTGVVTIVDQTGNPAVTVDTTQVIQNTEEEDVHPIAAMLASFFDMSATEVNDLHEDGFGFGLIAQALWMQKNLDDSEITAEMILQAKKNNDFSSLTLPDGTNPTNWGQFKKALLDKKNNLGVIVSGHADNDMQDPLNQTSNGNGKGKDKDNNPGKGKGKDKKP